MYRSRRSCRLPQIAIVVAAIILTASVSYKIKNITTYQETGTVVFAVKQSPAQVNASYGLVQSLTTTGEAMVQALLSQESRTLARRAGGTAEFSASITNFNNEDFPDYGYPLATVVVQGPAVEAVGATFKIVIGMLRNILSHKQAQAGASKAERITMFTADAVGPLAVRPSLMRAYAALGLLSVIGTGMSVIFTRRLSDRRSVTSRTGRGGRHRNSGDRNAARRLPSSG